MQPAPRTSTSFANHQIKLTGERHGVIITDVASVKYWEIIADNLSKAGWTWGCLATVDREGRTIFVVDAHRDDGKRLVVREEEKLTAFMELESAILTFK